MPVLCTVHAPPCSHAVLSPYSPPVVLCWPLAARGKRCARCKACAETRRGQRTMGKLDLDRILCWGWLCRDDDQHGNMINPRHSSTSCWSGSSRKSRWATASRGSRWGIPAPCEPPRSETIPPPRGPHWETIPESRDSLWPTFRKTRWEKSWEFR